jgi:hypothetical protein
MTCNPDSEKPMNAVTNQKLLTAVLVMQVLTLLGLWTGQRMTSNASAVIPDPGAQREAMVEQQKATNEKLDALIQVLKSGDVKVKVEEEK